VKNRINIDGVEYMPQSLVAEALSIIAGYSEMYDNLAANPSEPTDEEKRQTRALDRRWTSLANKVYPPAKKAVPA
jgi:hypothetical protein